MAPLLVLPALLLSSVTGQSWLTRDERAEASRIPMNFHRAEAQRPTCGTSDPGVMQMMMLPAMAATDIAETVMHTVMNPLMGFLSGHDEAEDTERNDDDSVKSNTEDTSYSSQIYEPHLRTPRSSNWRVVPPNSSRKRSRKDFWRELGQETAKREKEKSRRKKRSVSLYSYSPWLTNNIPYVLSPNLNRDDRLTIAKAMDSIERGSCVSFRPRGFSPYYIHIARECSCGSSRCAFNGAYANIGPGLLPGLPSRMRILTCLAPNDADAVGIITHELLHNMGMLHTHTRLDRGQHVNVNYLNVLPDKWIDYSWNPLQFPLGTEYDCDSIMHYRDTSFNIGNSITLEALDPSECRLKSRSNTPTSSDMDLINRLYNC